MDEQNKYEVIKSLVDHPETGNKDRAALKLGCTRRHINRMIAGYLKEGKTFFIHGNKGRKPSTTIADDVRKQIRELYRTKYYEANIGISNTSMPVSLVKREKRAYKVFKSTEEIHQYSRASFTSIHGDKIKYPSSLL